MAVSSEQINLPSTNGGIAFAVTFHHRHRPSRQAAAFAVSKPASHHHHRAKRWALLTLVSAIFLVTTGATFSSLGVLLPAMIEELEWSWAQAGLGFTVIGLFTGLSSTLPALTIKWLGLRLTYLTGGAMIAAGFLTFSVTEDLWLYMGGATLIGLGYSQTGAVPAVKVLSSWFSERRSFVIGVFFTSGAIGSVCGPLAASFSLMVLDSWRLYWLAVAGLTMAIAITLALFVSERGGSNGDTAWAGTSAQAESEDWTFGEVLRNPQYYIIVLAVTFTLFGALTMNAWQVTHMQNLGVAATVTASALSMHALFNAASRIMGGVIIDRVGAKLLFAVGLAAGVAGMLALSIADNYLLILIFAIGDGVSFGIVTFASSILLLKYYGAQNNPMVLGFLNLVTTLAMIGPVMAGLIADRLGGFMEIFIAIAAMMLVAFVLVALMKQPVRRARPIDRAS